MFKKHENKSLSIELIIRDASGKPTGRKTFASNSGFELWQFYMRYQKPHKKRKRKSKATTRKDAEQILSSNMDKWVENAKVKNK